MKWLMVGLVGCAPQDGAEWSGQYQVDHYESSSGCLEEAVEAEKPASSLGVAVSTSHLDVLLCEGGSCANAWWSGWIDSVGPQRVRASVAQALGSPSRDGTPLCSVAWSSVYMANQEDTGTVTMEGEIWQADSVPLEPYEDCWQVLDAYVEEDAAPCMGAWRFTLTSPP